jgi:predicted DNA-binding protein
MSKNEKKYGKVFTIRVRPEHNDLANQIKKDAEKTKASGVSEFIEQILLDYYKQKGITF